MATVAALARAGHEISLLMPRRDGDPDISPADLRAWFGVEGDFRLVRHESRWSGDRAPAAAAWLLRAFRHPVLQASDALLCRMPVILGLGVASPAPFAFDHYRPWPDELPLGGAIVRRLSKSPRCLGFVAHSRFAGESYARAGVDPEKLVVAHNGVETDWLEARVAAGDARARLGLSSDRPIILYAGRLNAQKGIDQLLAMAALRPGYAFILVGSEGKGEIERAAAAHANVRIVAWQPPGALADWLAAADVLVIPPSSAPLREHRNCVLPMKLYAYLAARRPILAPRSPDTAELLADGETARLVDPDDPAAAAAALDGLLADAGFASRLADAAFALVQGLTWDDRARRIGRFLADRLAQRSEYSRTVNPTSSPTNGAVHAPTMGGR